MSVRAWRFLLVAPALLLTACPLFKVKVDPAPIRELGVALDKIDPLAVKAIFNAYLQELQHTKDAQAAHKAAMAALASLDNPDRTIIKAEVTGSPQGSCEMQIGRYRLVVGGTNTSQMVFSGRTLARYDVKPNTDIPIITKATVNAGAGNSHCDKRITVYFTNADSALIASQTRAGAGTVTDTTFVPVPSFATPAPATP